jgi:hypothetical protein
MAHVSTVAQAADSTQHQTAERSKSATTARVQVPRELLRSPEHSGLAVVVWSMYETLMPRALGGGRAPAHARRGWVAERFGTSTRAIDDARRELLAREASDGTVIEAWLRRSSHPGRKRAVRHVALRLPRDTGQSYADVPAWTLSLVDAGRHRAEGSVTPAAWRLYACGVDKIGRDGGTFDATVGTLGELLNASPSTGRRRLRELETAGLFEVTAQPGGWFTVCVVVVQDQAEQAARRYAEHGRKVTAPRQHPCQPRTLTPTNELHSPLPADSTPQKSPVLDSPVEESPVPAVGADVQVVGPRAAAADAGRSRSKSTATPRRPRPGAVPSTAVELFRALPEALRTRIPEHGSRRVLRALAAELEHRSVVELAERIASRWEAWRYRPEEITDPTAIAITIVRRDYDCADQRCEDHVRLDTGKPCGHCDQENRARAALSSPQSPEDAPAGTKPPTQTAQRPAAALSAVRPLSVCRECHTPFPRSMTAPPPVCRDCRE